jgi:N-glycosylase/DNA lyase
MKKLLNELEMLKKSEVKDIINMRIADFKKAKSDIDTFNELCFCLLTANYSAEKAIRIQEEIKDGFVELSKDKLKSELKRLGYRYPNVRSSYIVEARKHIGCLKLDRTWLVKNVKGLGMKEASHFLRNIGHDDYAIIDFHIIDLLVEQGIIERPKTLTVKKYVEIEEKLRKISKEASLTLAELDLYLWYMETGKVLK